MDGQKRGAPGLRWAFSTVAAGRARASARLLAPRLSSQALPLVSARLSDWKLLPAKALAWGEAASIDTAKPPAEWPRMVTLAGSPPNLATLACTHFRPAIWSIRP